MFPYCSVEMSSAVAVVKPNVIVRNCGEHSSRSAAILCSHVEGVQGGLLGKVRKALAAWRP